MGSSKKHKEKKEKKKHKKRSKSHEKESRKKNRKSSSRKDKRKSPVRVSPLKEFDIPNEKKRHASEEASSHPDFLPQFTKHGDEMSPTLRTVTYREPSPDDDFDIDKLLDSKLSEKLSEMPVIKKINKKRIREEVLDELRKRQNFGRREEPIEKFSNDQVASASAVPSCFSKQKSPEQPFGIPFLTDVVIKQEPPDEDPYPQRLNKEQSEPKLCLSIAETNRLRAKLGLKPLEIKGEPPEPSEPKSSLSNIESRLRAKLGLKPLEVEREIPELSEPKLSLGINEANKLRAKLGLKPLDAEREIPEQSEPKLSPNISEIKKSRAKVAFKPLEDEWDFLEQSEPKSVQSIGETKKPRVKVGLRQLEDEWELPDPDDVTEQSEPKSFQSIGETKKSRVKVGLRQLEDEWELPARSEPNLSPNISEIKKSRAKVGGKSKPLEDVWDLLEQSEPRLSSSFGEAKKLGAKVSLKHLEDEGDLLEPSELRLSSTFGETKKSRAKVGLKPVEDEWELLEQSELRHSSSVGEAKKSRAKASLKPVEDEWELLEQSESRLSSSYGETKKSKTKVGLKPFENEWELLERSEPKLSPSIGEAKKSRLKPSIKPLEVEREISERFEPNFLPSVSEKKKSRSKHSLKSLEAEREKIPERSEAKLSPTISGTKKSRTKHSLKSLEAEREIPELSEPQLSLSISETNKLRAKLGLKPLDVGADAPERSESKLSPSISGSKKSRTKSSLKALEVEREIPEPSEPQLSLSINETNKLRAKLGLKPLDVGGDIPGIVEENGEKEPSKPVEVFVKTENIREVKKSEALREKLRVHKEKRAIEEKLRKTKTVAESDSEEESAADWVLKHQKLLQEKERADKRAKMLEEMDEEFGVGALVEEEFKQSNAYTSQHLKGLTIGHDVDAFKEGTPVILTLKDKGVLEEEEDVLENVNIVDNERYSKNVEVKKKKPGYQPYEEPEFDEFGILKKRNLLSKYDEELEGEKKKSFKIGTSVARPSYSTREQELELIRMKLKQQNKISLEMPELKIVNEYYTPEDMVQFKKPKKKIRRKTRKQALLKADDLLPDNIEETENDFGSRRKRRRVVDDAPLSADTQELEVPEITEDLTGVIIDEEDQAENELYSTLNKAKKLKQRQIQSSAPEKVMEILNKTNASENKPAEDIKGVKIELNSVAEFCRTLGEIPTYGMSGNRDEEADDLMDLERELLEEKQKQELEAQNRGAWNEVDIDEKPAEISVRENEPILEEEPDINLGVAGALKLAMKKGYLDKDGKKPANPNKASQLQAQSYTIEEKFYEDDKFGKRDRYTGPTQEFREKNNYKPDVKLEYIDDSGRLLTAKEAFRYLSHKFHGKGPGKNKVDKRMKKLDQDTRLKQMSSTDTPLNTVKLLQAKQKETQSPYIVLSGGNKTLTQTMISKTKL